GKAATPFDINTAHAVPWVERNGATLIPFDINTAHAVPWVERTAPVKVAPASPEQRFSGAAELKSLGVLEGYWAAITTAPAAAQAAPQTSPFDKAHAVPWVDRPENIKQAGLGKHAE